MTRRRYRFIGRNAWGDYVWQTDFADGITWEFTANPTWFWSRGARG